LIKRFQGAPGRRVLIEALLGQTLVLGDRSLASAIADRATLREIDPGTELIAQGGSDTDVFLILCGAFMIIVNGREWRLRGPGDHVGEMAAIEPSQPRSATVVAKELSVVAMLTQAQFWQLGEEHVNLWCVVAKELSRRLNQRNAQVRPVRHTPELFIASSTESLPIAQALKDSFTSDPFNVTLWTDGVFTPSGYPLDSLDEALGQSDFAIVIAAADDLVTSRRKRSRAPRDNVTFELGLAIGRLSRKRTLLLEPRTARVKLASDLFGLTTIPYDWNAAADPVTQMRQAAGAIRKVVLDLGPA
jgi:CRP/FNR family cyclic AMP-dependent transcriptional regulator